MKKIVIFGTNSVGKSTIYKNIQKIINSEEKKNIINPIVNYVESINEINGVAYNFIDTSTFNFPNKEDDLIEKGIKDLNDKLISSSDLIIWVIDSEKDFSDYNFSLQEYLEKKQKDYIIVFNKFKLGEKRKDEFLNNYYFQKLLKGNIRNYFVSSLSEKKGLRELIDLLEIEFNFQGTNSTESVDKQTKLTIFGPPNSGKSTLMNSLVKEERSVVSSIPGTTKEAVVTWWSRRNIDFQLKDTEGIINEKRNNRDILRDCDVAWAVIDVSTAITKQILQIVNLAEKCEKAVIIILNKTDLVDKIELEEKKEEIRSRLKSFLFVPIVCISAQTQKNISGLFKVLDEMIDQSEFNFSKNAVCSQFDAMLEKNPPSSINGKRLKVYYAIQEKGFVQKFIVFVNNPKLVHFSYERYLVNNLRKKFNITHLPVKLFFKKS
jgi:GTP-binding protein